MGVVGGKARTAFQKINSDILALGSFSKNIFRKESKKSKNVFSKKYISRPDRSQFYVQIDLNFTSRSTSTLRQDRSQLYVQIDLSFTSRSNSILLPDRSQFYVQIDFNFTSRSTSISHPDRPQLYVQIDLNLSIQIETCKPT